MRKILLMLFTALLLIIAGCSVPEQVKNGSSAKNDNGNGTLNAIISAIEPTEIKKITCGSDYSFVLLYNGDLYATGNNDYGQFGNGTTISSNNWNNMEPVATDVIDVAAGDDHSLIIKTDGRVYASGYNGQGQLGADNDIVVGIYNWILTTSGTNCIKVLCGAKHSLVLKDDGTLLAAGSNMHGQLGVSYDNFKKYKKFEESNYDGVIKIAVGRYSSFIIRNDYNVYGTGESCAFGIEGEGNDIYMWRQLTTDSNNKDIAGGNYHALILKNNGDVYTTGLIDGIQDYYTWTYFTNEAASIYAGGKLSLVKRKDKRLFVFGRIDDSGIITDYNNLEYILWDTRTAACGYGFVLAVKNSNNFYGLGKNTQGQLGLGSINFVDEINRIRDFDDL